MVAFAHRLNTRVSILLGVLVLLGAIPSSVAAQAPGVRAGISVDPDQFYVGGHFGYGDARVTEIRKGLALLHDVKRLLSK